MFAANRRWVIAAAVSIVAVAVVVTVLVTRPAHHRAALPKPTTTATTVPPSSTATIPTTTVTVPPSTTPTPPTVPPPSAGMNAAAAGYLKAANNSISYYQATPSSWVATARPFITPTLLAKLTPPPATPGISTSGGTYDYRLAHQNGWQVTADVTCAIDQTAAQPTATTATLGCSVTDTTVDQAGAPVPIATLPGAWPFAGAQQRAMLVLSNIAGTWLVATDETGSYPS